MSILTELTINGSQLNSNSIYGNEAQIELNVPKGIYFVKCINGKGQLSTKKWIVD